MILLQFDPKQVIVQRANSNPANYSSVSDCLSSLNNDPIHEPITVIYPCAGSIPSSPIEPLTGQLVMKLVSSQSYLPEWNKRTFETIEGLLPLVDRQPILVAFDDNLFRGLLESIRSYALPYELSQRYPRYGNDGLAHDWAFQQIRTDLKNAPLITIHLQDRPTLATFRDGKVVDTTTGYSPLDGLPGSTTCGTIDPSLPVMLASTGMASADIRSELSENSGWQTIPSPAAMRTNALVKAIGSMAASCHGLKTLFFFGDSLSEVVPVCERLSGFGLMLLGQISDDPTEPACITGDQSLVKVFSVRKDYPALLKDLIQKVTG